MNLFTISAGQVATSVWNNTTRTLTEQYLATLAKSNAVNQTIATTVTVSLNPAGAVARRVSAGMITPNTAGAAGQLGINDGVQTFVQTAIGQNASGCIFAPVTDSALFVAIANNGTQTNHYSYVVLDQS